MKTNKIITYTLGILGLSTLVSSCSIKTKRSEAYGEFVKEYGITGTVQDTTGNNIITWDGRINSMNILIETKKPEMGAGVYSGLFFYDQDLDGTPDKKGDFIEIKKSCIKDTFNKKEIHELKSEYKNRMIQLLDSARAYQRQQEIKTLRK